MRATEVSFELVTAEARKVEAKNLLRYCLKVEFTGAFHYAKDSSGIPTDL